MFLVHVARRKGHGKMARGVIKLTDVGEDCTKFLKFKGSVLFFCKGRQACSAIFNYLYVTIVSTVASLQTFTI